MSLRYGLRSAADLFKKLERDAAALEREVSSDATFNFVVTACHLLEWIVADPAIELPPSVRDQIVRSECFQACRDLANASKHFELDPQRNPDPTRSARSESGFGVGRFGAGSFGQGEESISVELKTGRTVDILELVRDVMTLYSPTFAESAS